MVINFNIDIGPNLRALGVKLMATIQDFTTEFEGFSNDLQSLKSAVEALEAKINTGGMTSDEEQTALDSLKAKRQELAAVVADINSTLNPTPAPEPTPNP
jgi:uncharacterized protein involved in exopolysaccharide biosynthesis